jgi:hypothetical protein
MDKYEKRTQEILRCVGAELVRQGRHAIYKLPDGQGFVRSKTPSDWRASRKSLASLRRLVNTRYESDPEMLSPMKAELAQEPPEKRAKFVTPNRDKRDVRHGHILSFDTREPKASLDSTSLATQFSSVEDLLAVIQHIDSYWQLDYCGRIRILHTFASQFAKTSILAVRFSSMEVVRKPRKCSKNEMLLLLNIKNQKLNWMRQYEEWGLTGLPALLIEDPKLGPVVIEVSGLPIIGKADDTAVIAANFDIEGTFMTHWPIWRGEAPPTEEWNDQCPDIFIAYTFFTGAGMKKWGVNYSVSEAWTNKRITRDVTADVLSLLRTTTVRDEAAPSE